MQEGGTLKSLAEMESGRKELKKESGEAAKDGEEERVDGAGCQDATETGTPIGRSWIQDRTITVTGGLRTRRGEEETGTPR
ncbi:hypothetical protein NDU88_003802 [Pleurodeles waltl]|uniref:Uncharacterized protein n=1 Tax=Pleurodeles waltl TaxID=8319 RepID=A0AAV7QE70_PLEWA|nr:hypothetical protein NDU88_003802 [Pleurodeles waltl]